MLWVQLAGTLLAFVFASDKTFQDSNPLLLTETGEFVLKNLVLITAGLVIGSTVRQRNRPLERDDSSRLAAVNRG
jgi:putative oxidoreductase